MFLSRNTPLQVENKWGFRWGLQQMNLLYKNDVYVVYVAPHIFVKWSIWPIKR